ncbi:MAG: suppressor of fused domain protein [Deltaproteobacteria bacterium]|nr:suppressor of fused domain protein [Deltaproteobacteria bacterium]
MGLKDWFGKKKIEAPAAPPPESDEKAEGWDAIEAAFLEHYPGQTDPPHVAPGVYRMHDLSENAAAFDGMSAYDAGTFWHLVSFGLTELYAKENVDQPEVSGFGYELTFRIPKTSERPPALAFRLLDAIGKAVWGGQDFAPGHTIQTGPIDGRPETKETAMLVLRDPLFPEPLSTPHGQVDLLLLLGVENALREAVMAAYEESEGAEGWEAEIVARIREANPELVTPLRA